MTPMQVASSVVEKLQEENRISIVTLHKAQDRIKSLERQVYEKEQLIKILESKIRTGSNTFLESSHRQKDITIKHLELQIQKLQRENQDLRLEILTVKGEICPRCETKLFLGSDDEEPERQKPARKTARKGLGTANRPPKSITAGSSEHTEMRRKLELIIEHKDRRIQQLSSSVKNLKESEKELTAKNYRLRKLLPMSHMPSETLIECLLKEIQALESQLQERYNKSHEVEMANILTSTVANSISGSSKISYSSAKPTRRAAGHCCHDKSSLVFTLQDLHGEIRGLKKVFASENEKLHIGLGRTLAKNDMAKAQWKGMIDRLDELSEIIRGILSASRKENEDTENVISKLQARLSEALESSAEHEKRSDDLRLELAKLQLQLEEERRVSHLNSVCELEKKLIEARCNVNDHVLADAANAGEECYKNLLEAKEQELQASRNHLETCQKFILELQKKEDGPEKNCILKASAGILKNVTFCKELEVETLQKKLNVAEKNIRSLENLVESLQTANRDLREESKKLNSDLDSAIHCHHKCDSLEADLRDSEKEVSQLRKTNRNLDEKVSILEEEVLKLHSEMKSSSEEIDDLRSKADRSVASDCQVAALETKVSTLQRTIDVLKIENTRLKSDASRRSHIPKCPSKAEEVRALTAETIRLRESLSAYEKEAIQLSYYRRQLRHELLNLQRVLDEESACSLSEESRRAICKAAVLRAAEQLLQLDSDSRDEDGEVNRTSALEEMKRQVSIYVTEVARIYELISKKNQMPDSLFREYIIDQSGSSTSQAGSENMQVTNSAAMELHCATLEFQNQHKCDSHQSSKSLEEELAASKSLTTHLVSNCARLEKLLEKERSEREKSGREKEKLESAVHELRCELSSRNSASKRLNSLVEAMRSKECTDDITARQLRSEIEYLCSENRKVLDRVTEYQAELARYREDNHKVRNDIDAMKRELLNEKYEHAKVRNQLEHLKSSACLEDA